MKDSQKRQQICILKATQSFIPTQRRKVSFREREWHVQRNSPMGLEAGGSKWEAVRHVRLTGQTLTQQCPKDLAKECELCPIWRLANM